MMESLAPGGRLLLANTCGVDRDCLLHPSPIDTYRDLFRHAGLPVLREGVRQVRGSEVLPALVMRFERA